MRTSPVVLAPAVQVNPADDALDKVVPIGQFQEPACLLDHLPALDGNRAVKADGLQKRRQFRRQIIAPQGVHSLGHPAVLTRHVIPKMLVTIKSHGKKGFEI